MKDESVNVAEVYTKIFAFFDAVICDDQATKALINSAVGHIAFKKGQLVFDLLSLYRLLFPLNDIDYSEFKQILYRSELNKALMKKEALVVVWQPSSDLIKSKVDGNLYCLKINVKERVTELMNN